MSHLTPLQKRKLRSLSLLLEKWSCAVDGTVEEDPDDIYDRITSIENELLLDKIGIGGGRDVFTINAESSVKVVKVAQDTDGVEQNQMELTVWDTAKDTYVKSYSDSTEEVPLSTYLPTVFEQDSDTSNFRWTLLELCDDEELAQSDLEYLRSIFMGAGIHITEITQNNVGYKQTTEGKIPVLLDFGG